MKHLSFAYTQLNYQTVLFLTIPFNISHLSAHSLNKKQFYLTLSGVTIPDESEPESNNNERELCIPQISKAEALPSDFLTPYPEYSWRGDLASLQRCSWYILVLETVFLVLVLVW